MVDRPSHVDEPETVVEYDEYTRIVRFVDARTGGERYRFEAATHEGAEFQTLDEAKLYADVYWAVDSFREGKSGRRGVPPTVAMASNPTTVAYLVTQSGMGVEWASRAFDITEGTVRDYLSRVRRQAEEIREADVDDDRDGQEATGGQNDADVDEREQSATDDDSQSIGDVSECVETAVDDVASSWADGGDRLAQRRRAAALVLQTAIDGSDAVGKSSAVVEEARERLPVEGQSDETYWRKNIRPVLSEYGEYDNGRHGYVVESLTKNNG